MTFSSRLLHLAAFALMALSSHQACARSEVSLELSEAEEAEISALALPIPTKLFGDFDRMLERRTLRILVPYSRTLYFIDRGKQLGMEYEYGAAFQQAVNRRHKFPKGTRFQVVFIPVSRDRLLADLADGLGDVALGALTVTPAREKLVDFSAPVFTGIKEVVVMGREADPVPDLEAMSGKRVLVRRSSSYYEHLLELNGRFAGKGMPPIQLQEADEDLEDEDLMEMANAGLAPYLVVDRYKANLWARAFKNIKVRDDLVVNEGGAVAWAMRKGSPKLKAEIDHFLGQHRIGQSFGNAIVQRYVQDGKILINPGSAAAAKRFNDVVGIFQDQSARYKFDPLMLMAQGFQESALNQSARSPRGAVGIMQLLPTTAADPVIGISEIETSAAKNVEAGAKYLRHLIDRYLDDPDIDEKNRTLMAFAAYNAGPGNLRKMRRLAEKSGLDPNIWFHNVEIAAARLIGNETVQYVGNIYKYYVAYKLTDMRAQARDERRSSQ